jgi:hypothetical protein
VLRLGVLPVRPHTARCLIAALPESPADEESEPIATPKLRAVCALDPGWVLAQGMAGARASTLAMIAERPWWPRSLSTGAPTEALGRLWRHAVAVSIGSRWLARQARDPEPEEVARAGLLCSLGCWAVAAVEPEWLVSWLSQEDPRRRRQQERDELGAELPDLGRRLAERWGCTALVVDAAWLHAEDRTLGSSAATRPEQLSFIQQGAPPPPDPNRSASFSRPTDGPSRRPGP